MPRRSVAVRTISVLLALLLGLSGPAATFAHGVAHVREHVVATDHGTDAHHGAQRDVHHDAPDDRDASPGTHDDDAPASDESVGGHDHAQADAALLKRAGVAAYLPSYGVVLPAPRIVATADAPAPVPPLERAEPPTGPPPAARAPPLG